MRLSINCGHTTKGPGYGAVSGSFKESQVTRAVGNELIRILKAKGHTVHNSTVNYADSQNAYLKRVVEMANGKNIDLFVSLHCNASAKHSANGVEVHTYKGRKLPEAVDTCNSLEDIGFRNRGIKDGSSLYVIKHTNAKAMLVEMFFLDNKTDQTLYNRVGYKGIARAIADAIL